MESVLLDMAIKGAIVLALTGAGAAMLGSASAATRHLVWSIGLAGVVALPGLAWVLPEWGLAVLPAASPAQAPEGPPGASPTAEPVPWLAILWAAGTLLVVCAFLLGRARVWWLARHAVALESGPWPALTTRLSGEMELARRVRLLQSRRSVMPMMWGILRPTILLPGQADRWSEGLKRDVMLHELAHVKRNDYLSQILAGLACALHWFNPLAWVAARRLRVERERACDDHVLTSGASPFEYAEHLLAVARWRAAGVARSTASPTMVLCMAGASALGDRLKAVLEAGQRRAGLSRRAVVGQGTLAALLVVSLAVLHPEAGSPAASTVEDPGGILPVPPSVSAGLSPAPRPMSEPQPSLPVTQGPKREAKPPDEHRSPRPAVRPAPAPPTIRIHHEAGTGLTAVAIPSDRVDLLTRARIEIGVEKESCSESKESESEEGAPETQTRRAALVAVPRPVHTP